MVQNPAGLDRVEKQISRYQKEMVRFLAQFCAFPTVNPPGNQYEQCVQFLQRKLKSLGLATRVVRPPLKEQLKLVPDSQAYPRPSIIARWDVGARRTLLLTGHYDVVPPTSGMRAATVWRPCRSPSCRPPRAR